MSTPACSNLKDWKSIPRKALSATEIVSALARLDGWKLSGDGANVAIEKTFSFTNYFRDHRLRERAGDVWRTRRTTTPTCRCTTTAAWCASTRTTWGASRSPTSTAHARRRAGGEPPHRHDRRDRRWLSRAAAPRSADAQRRGRRGTTASWWPATARHWPGRDARRRTADLPPARQEELRPWSATACALAGQRGRRHDRARWCRGATSSTGRRDPHQVLRGQPRPRADPDRGRARVLRAPAGARADRGRGRAHHADHRAQQERPGRNLRARLGAASRPTGACTTACCRCRSSASGEVDHALVAQSASRARPPWCSGPSGAGKSTLTNLLVPGATALTREISQALNSGKHTTTSTTGYWVDGGAQHRPDRLAGLPGIRPQPHRGRCSSPG